MIAEEEAATTGAAGDETWSLEPLFRRHFAFWTQALWMERLITQLKTSETK